MRLVKLFVWSILPMFLGVVSPHISADVMAVNFDAKHMDVLVSSQNQQLKLVRIGLNKSIIIDLPQASKEVLVSNPKIADAVMRTSHRVYLIGMEMGETNIFFFDKNGKQILALELHVEQDIAALQDLYRRIFPDTKINIDILNGSLVLTGMAQSASHAAQIVNIASQFVDNPQKVINMLTMTDKQQVFLKVIIAEVSKNLTSQLGLDMSKWMGSLDVLNPPLFTSKLLSTPPFGGGVRPMDNYMSFGFNGSEDGIDMGALSTIRAMEKNNFLRTLAEPTITAISGEQASFLAGGEFPVPSSSDNGQISVEYKPFGVSLSFLPVVLSRGRISMKVQTEVSEVSSSGAVQLGPEITANGLRVRRTNTTVELPSGGSMVIAGLLKDDTKHEFNGMPGIKDVPILGPLFRSKYFQRNESEMLIVVMPYLVKPTAPGNLSLPTDPHPMVTSGSRDDDIFRQINRIYGATGGQTSGLYQGKIGFIVQ